MWRSRQWHQPKWQVHIAISAFVFGFALVVLGVELRILQLPGRCNTTWALFALVTFQIGSPIYAGLASTALFLFIFPRQMEWQVWTTMPNHWLRWGLPNFLPGLALNCDPPQSPLPNSLGLQGGNQCPALDFFLKLHKLYPLLHFIN
jgi:hypothetical protein